LPHWTLGEHQSANKKRGRVEALRASGSKSSMTILVNRCALSG
jgi:hypothetical protein